MKNDVSENMAGLDKIQFKVRTFVNLPSCMTYEDLKEIPGAEMRGKSIALTRAIAGQHSITGYFQKLKYPKIQLVNFLNLNGVEVFRKFLPMDSGFAQQRSTSGGLNFLPLGLQAPSLGEFCLKDFPKYCNQRVETAYLDVVANLGDAAKALAPRLITVQKAKDSPEHFLEVVEAFVDISVPANADILNNYNFKENLAKLGTLGLDLITDDDGGNSFNEDVPGHRFHTDKTFLDDERAERDCLQLVGTAYGGGFTFSIYIKDKNNPETHQLRIEIKVKPGRASKFKKTFYTGQGDRNLKAIFYEVIHERLLPFARSLMDLDYPEISKRDRDGMVESTIRSIKTGRWNDKIASALALEIFEKLISNDLTVRASDCSPAAAKLIRSNHYLFKNVKGSAGLRYLNRRALSENAL